MDTTKLETSLSLLLDNYYRDNNVTFDTDPLTKDRDSYLLHFLGLTQFFVVNSALHPEVKQLLVKLHNSELDNVAKLIKVGEEKTKYRSSVIALVDKNIEYLSTTNKIPISVLMKALDVYLRMKDKLASPQLVLTVEDVLELLNHHIINMDRDVHQRYNRQDEPEHSGSGG